MTECCLFDLDGTLLSTLDTIRYHLNNTLKSFGLLEITEDECSRFIGDGARKLVERATAKTGGVSAECVEAVLKTYNEAYDSDPLPHTEPYPGVVDLVASLKRRGIRLGVVTNKPESTARQLIEHFFSDSFDLVCGGREGAILKPDPRESLAVVERLGASPETTVFIGDTPVDVRTGKNMGASLTVGVTWGFRTREELLRSGADTVIESADALLELL